MDLQQIKQFDLTDELKTLTLDLVEAVLPLYEDGHDTDKLARYAVEAARQGLTADKLARYYAYATPSASHVATAVNYAINMATCPTAAFAAIDFATRAAHYTVHPLGGEIKSKQDELITAFLLTHSPE